MTLMVSSPGELRKPYRMLCPSTRWVPLMSAVLRMFSVFPLVSSLNLLCRPPGDPVGPNREAPQRNGRRNRSLRDRVPLLCVRRGQSRGGLQASQGGPRKGTAASPPLLIAAVPSGTSSRVGDLRGSTNVVLNKATAATAPHRPLFFVSGWRCFNIGEQCSCGPREKLDGQR